MEPVLLAVVLVAYNNVVNLWAPFHGGAYVPMNLAVAAGVLAAGLGPLELSGSMIGFAGGWAGGLAAGAGIGATIAAVVFAAALHPKTRRLVADERVRGVQGSDLAYRVAVRVPLGTAVLEEVAFRGVLYAAWRSHGVTVAAIASSVAFGLWHVTPTWNLIQRNRPSARPAGAVGGIVATVAATAAVGIALCALREASEGLAAPFALHASVNSLTTGAAVWAHRRSGKAS